MVSTAPTGWTGEGRMAISAQKKGYLGFFIAGGLVTSAGGSLLVMGITFAWMGGFFGTLMSGTGGLPVQVFDMFGTMGIGSIIGGIAAIVVGLSLLGTGVSKKNRYKANNAQTGGTPGLGTSTPVGRDYLEVPMPPRGSMLPLTASTASDVGICRSCGERLPSGLDAHFCPGCGAHLD